MPKLNLINLAKDEISKEEAQRALGGDNCPCSCWCICHCDCVGVEDRHFLSDNDTYSVYDPLHEVAMKADVI